MGAHFPMMIYMTHPQHGAMHVYLEAEAAANEKNGWTRVEQKSVEKAVEKAPERSLEERYEEKFGKKPHHRMLPETIEAALKE